MAMITGEQVLTGARLVLPEGLMEGSMLIREGRIADVSPGRSTARGVEDLEGDLLMAGLIDLHTDNLETHYVPRPGTQWLPLPAILACDAELVAAGITTVCDSLALAGGPSEVDRRGMLMPLVHGLTRAREARALRAEHLLHLRCEVTEPRILEYLDAVMDRPEVHMLSIMDHAPGHRQSPDVTAWESRLVKREGLSSEQARLRAKERIERSQRIGPEASRAIATRARARGLPLASHDDQTVEHVADAVRLGVCISEFPTTLAAAKAARAQGLWVLMGAPNLMRGQSSLGNVSAGELAMEGALDLLASDYIPGSLLPAALRLTQAPFHWSLHEAVRTVTSLPAEAARLEDRGRLAAGLRADLVRVRLLEELPLVRGVWSAGRRVF